MTSQTVHAIWSRELDLPEFSDDDDFFQIGGHSLIMTRIQKAIADDLGVEISMDKLLRESTVSRIAAHIDSLLAVS